MKHKIKIKRSGLDKVTVEFAKYHSTRASEFRSVDLYDDEVEMLKEEFCNQFEKKLAEAKKIIKGFVNSNGFISSNSRFYERAEEFLKEE